MKTKKFQGYLKIIPTIETEEDEPTEDEILNSFLTITESPYDWIGFEEVKKEGTIQEKIKDLFNLLDKDEMEEIAEELSEQARNSY